MYLIPQPQKITYTQNTFSYSYDSDIVLVGIFDTVAYNAILELKEQILRYTGFDLGIRRSMSEEKGDFLIILEDNMKDQEYKLLIQESGVRISASGIPGLLYAIQTLKQIIEQEGACLPCMFIHDYPDIPNRGYYYDVTRGRIPTVAYLKKWIDLLAKYKYNQFQLYIEYSFLFQNLSEMWRDDTPLTASDILELDEYCASKGIELVPSIATFGHLYKLLRTNTYRHLCEMEEQCDDLFGMWDRMAHHTLDVTNEESFLLVKSLIDEYIPLFRSNKFNICADETFDLGKGKSKPVADQIGVDNLYVGFVKKLCDHVISRGKTPMFWGDIIYKFPEKIKELPSETILLNWGYDANVTEDSTRVLAESGARLYNCPGVSGWNQFVNRIDASYENIKRMCTYANKYHAEGILNTDWGDFGHINHPDMGIAGMIYGAAFSWNKDIPERDDINRSISRLEYHDITENVVSLISDISEMWTLQWYDLICMKENKRLERENLTEETLADSVKRLTEKKGQILAHISQMSADKKDVLAPYIMAIDGMILLQEAEAELLKKQSFNCCNKELAEKIERWLYHYKKEWRRISQESELFRIQEVFIWLADKVR